MEKKDFQRLIHTWMEEKVKKAIVYNTKEEKRKEKKKGRKKEEKTKRGVYSQVIALEHVRGYFSYRYTRITLSF